MESRHGKPAGTAAPGELHHTLFHLFGSLIGKGYRRNVMRLNSTGIDQVSNFAGNHTRLARARTREHQQGAINILGGFSLTGVELT